MLSFDIRFAPLVISPFHCYSFNTMPEEQAGPSAYDKHEYDEIPGGMHRSLDVTANRANGGLQS